MGARVRRYGLGSVMGTVVALALGLSAIGPVAAQDDAGVAARDNAPATGSATVTMVQANIYTKLSSTRFQKDVRTVLAIAPDVISYNEVPFRQDAIMAPEGYAIYRDMSNRFTAATPVAWRTDRWTAVDNGHPVDLELARPAPGQGGRARPADRQLGDAPGRRRPGDHRDLGPRRAADARHARPAAPVGAAASTSWSSSSRRAGPVLVGGDFNVHYTSGRYPRDAVRQRGGSPRRTTCSVTGSRPVTTSATPSTTCSAAARASSPRPRTTRWS